MPRRSPRGRPAAPSSLPQPKPLGTLVIRETDGTALVVRHFEPEAAAACTRCPKCVAHTALDDPRGRSDIVSCKYDPTDHRPFMVCAVSVAVADLVKHAF